MIQAIPEPLHEDGEVEVDLPAEVDIDQDQGNEATIIRKPSYLL